MQGVHTDSSQRGRSTRGRGRGSRGGGRGRGRGYRAAPDGHPKRSAHQYLSHSNSPGSGQPVGGNSNPPGSGNPGRGNSNPPGLGHPGRGHSNPPGSGQSSHTKGIPHYYQPTPRPRQAPNNGISQKNMSMFTHQEELLIQKGYCPTCITSTCPSLTHQGQCPQSSAPTPIWNASVNVFNRTGLRLTKGQTQEQFPRA